MSLSIGIDIGGTNTRVAVVTPEGTVRGLTSFRTGDFDDGKLFCKHLADLIKVVISNEEVDDGVATNVGIGIGAPNASHHSGCIEKPPNLKFKGRTPIVALLKAELGIQNIVINNDANAAAIGEKAYGAAKDYADFIMITLGTGLGSGLFVNNQLVNGHDGFAGELGHITVIPGGRRCGFGRQGSLETYCSATGIRRTFFEKIANLGKKTSLDHLPIEKISSKDISDAAYAGDEVAVETIQFTGELLGKALASIALGTSPAAFFLFGGPVKAGSILLDPTRRAFEEHLIPVYKNKIQIIESALPMGDAAILGAAALVAK